MVYELLKRAIEQKNEFMSKEILELQIEFFFVAGKLNEVERGELLEMLNPVEERPIEEEILEA